MPQISPREILMIFTAGWLGGLGVLSALDPHDPAPMRVIGLAQAIAAALWFSPRTRTFGFGASLAVLAVAAVRWLIAGQLPGALVFYAAVVLYLAAEEHRAGKASAED